MAGKLWDKGYEPDKMIEEYTVGDDRELDMRLARYDVEGSLAHIAMLETIGLLTAEELEKLTAGLKEIAAEIEAGRFEIEPGTEDVHSQVELMLHPAGWRRGQENTLGAFAQRSGPRGPQTVPARRTAAGGRRREEGLRPVAGAERKV